MGIHHVTDLFCASCNAYDGDGSRCEDCRGWLCRDCLPCMRCLQKDHRTCDMGTERQTRPAANAYTRSICRLCFLCGAEKVAVQHYLRAATGCENLGEILKNAARDHS